MKGLKRKFIVSLIAIMFAIVALGTVTYAYWASNVKEAEKTAEGTVTIGEGNVAETDVVVGGVTGTGPLVPANRLAQSPIGSVSFVVLEFVVEWNSLVADQAKGAEGVLAASVSDKAIDNNAGFAGLVGTKVRIGAGFDADGTPMGTEDNNIIVDGATVLVFVKVTLTEPNTQADYLAIFGQNITFNVTFEVTPVVAP